MNERAPNGSGNGTATDIDADETREWIEAVDAVVAHDGPDRVRDLLTVAVERAQHKGTGPIATLNTPYVNTISPDREAKLPGDPALERRLRSIVRWNAMAMVVRANKTSSELGGHIASYQSLATLYEVGFNHFWRAPSDDFGGDLVYFQGHSSPGNYARAYLEGRLSAEDLDGFRQEVSRGGLSSYPHPWLMPDFWQFPTVSLGIGAITSIYQARFMKYLQARERAQTDGRKVWAFLGDGEIDEPETMGSIGMAGREHLDNLIWVVNCNLQRLDGPVRGNGKIIQELESDFRGAGWNVIKVIWGTRWDPLLAQDTDGRLVRVMDECLDGDYQTFKSRDGAFVREHFFGRDPVLKERVADMSDDEIWLLNRGGHDQQKVYAAYHAAVNHTGRPTVILAKTIKGYGMGAGAGEGQMITHQAKKMAEDALLRFRDRFELPLTDEQVRAAEYYKPPEDSPEMQLPARAPRRSSAAACRCAGARRPSSRYRRWRRSRASSRAPATARSRPRWPSCACSPRCCATSSSAATSCRSCPTSRARSAWRGCFARSASTRPSASSTSPRTPPSSCSTRRISTGRSSRRASPRPARSRPSSPPAPPTAPTRSRWCRSTSTTRCSAISASATSCGPPPTAARAASCSAAPPGARRSTARACSTRTATATCCSRSCPTSAPMTRRSPTSWRSSSRTGCAACSASRRTSSTTSP